jgi:hypothetical protein
MSNPKKSTEIEKILDQFYTNESTAQHIISVFNNYYPLDEFDVLLEPCVGQGSIFNNLPEDKRLGFDLDPKIDVPVMDYLMYLNNFEDRKVAVITNPPYGSHSKTAIKFFQKSATLSDVIGFIIPVQWKRYSLQKQLPVDFRLAHSEDLPLDSFIFKGQPYEVKTCFQIWTRDTTYPNLRIVEEPEKTHPDFSFTTNRQEADFLLTVCGKRTNYVRETQDTISNKTTERIITHQPYVRDIMESINWSKYGEQSTGTMWINREMIVAEYKAKKLEMGL